MSTIGKVKDLMVGQAFRYDGIQCLIDSFPTRTSVVVRNFKPKSGEWATCKTTIREFKRDAHRVMGD